MGKFTGLLNILRRDFRVVDEVDHNNGFVEVVYTENGGYTTHKVEFWEKIPRTIIMPDGTQWYSNGECQKFKK